MNDGPLLELDAVVAGHVRPVVGPVSFAVRAGEVLGLSGPNGSGKSTLLAAITGSARIFAGSVRRRMGLRLVHHRQRPEAPAELPLRGRELLRLLRVEEAGLPDWLRAELPRPVDELSGGRFQFLLTSACLGSSADLVLLDEPTNNLDGPGVQLLAARLRELGPVRSVVLVSHETEFLRANCTRIIELRS